MVTAAQPCIPFGRRQQRIDFKTSEKADQSLLLAFIGNSQYSLNEAGVLWRLQRGVPEERSDHGHPEISASHAVMPTMFQVVEKDADHWCVQIFQRDLRGHLAQFLLSELQQYVECIPVGSDCVWARSALCHQTLCKKGLQKRWKTSRMVHRCSSQRFSRRSPAAAISSGVLLRYQ